MATPGRPRRRAAHRQPELPHIDRHPHRGPASRGQCCRSDVHHSLYSNGDCPYNKFCYLIRRGVEMTASPTSRPGPRWCWTCRRGCSRGRKASSRRPPAPSSRSSGPASRGLRGEDKQRGQSRHTQGDRGQQQGEDNNHREEQWENVGSRQGAAESTRACCFALPS